MAVQTDTATATQPAMTPVTARVTLVGVVAVIAAFLSLCHVLGITQYWAGFIIIQGYTKPELVCFEIDVGWVKAAGHDPVELLQRYSGRYRMIHLKDIKPSTKTDFALKLDPAVVGEGMLDWNTILPAAREAGVIGYYVEQEPPFTMPRLDAVRKSYEYLSRIKV